MDTTSGDARFDRYYRRIQLGLRLLSHGARAQTACDWSGLTPDRLITLKRRWLPDAGDGFRGPAPTSFQPFFRSSVVSARSSAAYPEVPDGDEMPRVFYGGQRHDDEGSA